MVMWSQLLHDHGFGTEIESEVQKAPWSGGQWPTDLPITAYQLLCIRAVATGAIGGTQEVYYHPPPSFPWTHQGGPLGQKKPLTFGKKLGEVRQFGNQVLKQSRNIKLIRCAYAISEWSVHHKYKCIIYQETLKVYPNRTQTKAALSLVATSPSKDSWSCCIITTKVKVGSDLCKEVLAINQFSTRQSTSQRLGAGRWQRDRRHHVEGRKVQRMNDLRSQRIHTGPVVEMVLWCS